MTAQQIVKTPWKRIYTFNVDNCLKKAANNFIKNNHSDADLEIINYCDDFKDIVPSYVQSLVHLHGSIDRPNDGYIFSHVEYSRNINRSNSWMATLTQLMRSEPFIVSGTTLDEIDVAYYLENRSISSTAITGLPSVLIEPFPDRLTEKLCEDHGFILFVGTYLQFQEQLQTEFGSQPNIYLPKNDLLPYIPSSVSNRDKICFSESFLEVPKFSSKATKAASFFLGGELGWDVIEANLDVRREVYSDLEHKISHFLNDDVRLFLILDDLGTGKTSILRRLSYKISKKERYVFIFNGRELVEEDSCSTIFNSISAPVYIFVDNIADHVAYIHKIMSGITKRNIIFVGTERKYRRSYVEDGFSDEDIAVVESQLDLKTAESERLIKSYQNEGLAERGDLSGVDLKKFAREISNSSISIGSCRIQNNFYSFDKIITGLVEECSDVEIKTYLLVGISRHCYSGGIHQSILKDAIDPSADLVVGDIYARLPLTYAKFDKGYILPSRSAIADRVISIMQREKPKELFDAMVRLANSLASRVNRQQIRARAPSSKLASGLMDFDRVIKRFINGSAEDFYDQIKENWSWNSRYWEQRALLNLDRFLVSKDDHRKLEEAIQNARYAYSIEKHPLSLTTLAKMLFAALDVAHTLQDDIFREGWLLINDSIYIEEKWTNIRPTAFIVCFRGVLSYVRKGGMLDGEQAERLRDIVSITHRRKLSGRNFEQLRAAIVEEAF